MKTLLLLTNLYNDSPEEDIEVSQFLRDSFRVVIAHPIDCEHLLDTVDIIVVRNIWPTHEYREEWSRIHGVLGNCGKPVFDSLDGSGDNHGKKYMLEVYQRGLPIIPSVSSIKELDTLPESETYWIKPYDSCDGIGAEKLTYQELVDKNPEGYIIQPYINFECELSFFYINNVFHHAFTTVDRLQEVDRVHYEPSAQELEIAQKFVDWNTLTCGIQRIDFVRTEEGELLLTEVEDCAPYLFLFHMPQEIQQSLLNSLSNELLKLIENND